MKDDDERELTAIRAALASLRSPGRVVRVPDVVVVVKRRNRKTVTLWQWEDKRHAVGDWPQRHPLAVEEEREARPFMNFLAHIHRLARLDATRSNGAKKNITKGKKTAAAVLNLAREPRIARLGRGMAAHIAKRTKISKSQVRRILARKEPRMTEKG